MLYFHLGAGTTVFKAAVEFLSTCELKHIKILTIIIISVITDLPRKEIEEVCNARYLTANYTATTKIKVKIAEPTNAHESERPRILA